MCVIITPKGVICMKVYPLYPGKKTKAFTLSYDDGVKQDIRFIELLNKYGLKCTFNLNSGLFEKRGREPEEMIKVYQGHEVAVHSVTHPSLEVISPQSATQEIFKDRENLEEIFGGSIRGGAYPYGTYDEDVVDILKKCGIKYFRTIKSTGSFKLPKNWLLLDPTCRHKDPKLFELCDTFINTQPVHYPLYLFYVWGHTYEFDNDNNWEMIEEFFKKVSGNDEVWYATNIEIYDYLDAFYSLQTSLDCKYIHNPTAKTICFNCEEGKFELGAGETINFRK